MTLAATRPAPEESPTSTERRHPAERLLEWSRTNRLFVAALLIGAALRIVVMVAYPPALEFYGDSPAYLSAADRLSHVDIWHPPGYPFLLRIVSVTGSLTVLTALQHLFGLVAAVVVYRPMRRFGAGAVAATVATLPLLVDAYQIDVEHFVLSDSAFVLLLVLALALAVRLRDRGSDGVAVAIGLLLAALTLTRTVGIVVAVPVAAYLLASRIGARRFLAAAAAFALPVGAYATAFSSTYGKFGLDGFTGRYLFGLVAPYANCKELSDSDQSLCPKQPTYARPGLNQFVWQSPAYLLLPGTDIEKSNRAGRFAGDVMLHQPGATAATVAGNVAHYFQPGRPTGERDWFVGSWQFPMPNRPPAWNVSPATVGFGGEPVSGHIDVGLAKGLRGYQRVVYTPGPALLLALLLTGWAAVRRRHDGDARPAAMLLASTGFVLLLAPSASAGFDWRYLLPAQAVLLPAGLLAGRLVAKGLRARWSPTSRRIATTAVAAAVLVPGLPSSSVYAAADLRASSLGKVPATLDVGEHLRVRVGKPALVATECAETARGYRVHTLARFPVSVRRRSGGTFLVQPANFGIAGQNPFTTVALPDPTLTGVLRAALLSARFTTIRGELYVRLPAVSGRLSYVDPRGAGAAAWAYRIPAPKHGPAAGDRCTPPPAPLPRPPAVRHIPAFTTQSVQPIGFGPRAHPAPTGTTYDVRWQLSSPTAAPGRWHYPRPWQKTALQSLTLTGLAPGSTYCFTVRAHRATGTETAWSEPRCTTRFLDDSALPATGVWRRFTRAQGFYGATYSSTSERGATLSVSGVASRVAVIVYRCPDCGVLAVRLGDHRLKRLNLSVPAARSGWHIWRSLPLWQPGRQVVRLRVLSQRRVVAVDGVALQR